MASWWAAAVWLRNPKRADNLEISTSADGCVVCRPGKNQLHFLNPTAILILELCTGKNSPQQIAQLVQEAYGLAEPPVEDVRNALAHSFRRIVRADPSVS